MKTVEVKLSEMDDMLKIAECQRDISVRLSIVLENSKRNNEHLKIIKGLSERLASLKQKHKANFIKLK